jgi:hypothetical protein
MLEQDSIFRETVKVRRSYELRPCGTEKIVPVLIIHYEE